MACADRNNRLVQWRGRIGALILTLPILGGLEGCAGWTSVAAGQGPLTLRGRLTDAVVSGAFSTAVYRFEDANHLTIVLLDGTEEQPRQAVVLRMAWQPWAGYTPVDATAVNATIQYVIFAGSDPVELGIYSGAGFVYPHQRPGRERLKLSLWDSTLQLSDRTQGFEDRLGSARLTGTIEVRQDAFHVQRLTRWLNQKVTQALGYPRFVRGCPLNASAVDQPTVAWAAAMTPASTAVILRGDRSVVQKTQSAAVSASP